MATVNVQNYELMVIFTPILAEDEFKNAQKKITSFLEENAGTIVHSNPWGLRTLAYPIEKKTTGIYYVLEFSAPTDVIAKLEVQLNRDENVMRHMVTRLDKFALAYNDRKRNAPAKAKETKAEATENEA